MNGGKVSNDEALADADSFGGLPPEWAEALQSEKADFEVWAENWPIVELFLVVQTQWRQGFSGPTGLDYPAVFQTMDRMKIADPDGELFAGVQVMEIEVLRLLSQEA